MLTESERSNALDAILDRVDSTRAAGLVGFPHYADGLTGAWTRTPKGDWTGGFWIGELWLAGYLTGSPEFLRAAAEWTEELLPRVDSDTVFRGFLFWYGAAIGDRLVGSDRAREVAMLGAGGLRNLYNPAVGLVPLGTTGEEAENVGRSHANIDGVPGLVPLWVWAADITGDVSFRANASSHAWKHVDLCVRADGSVCQSAEFVPETGEVLRRYTHKGLHDDSTWTRAQAWGMLGYAHAASWVSRDFLDVATRLADWWITHAPHDNVAWWDFDAPGTLIDTSGTAIAAAALLKIAALDPPKADRYRAEAEAIVQALVRRHLTPTKRGDARPRGMLTGGCYNNRIGLATDSELVWGDYFLLEALAVLAHPEITLTI